MSQNTQCLGSVMPLAMFDSVPTMRTPMRVLKLVEQSTGQKPEAASGRDMFEKEGVEEVSLAEAKGEPDPSSRCSLHQGGAKTLSLR